MVTDFIVKGATSQDQPPATELKEFSLRSAVPEMTNLLRMFLWSNFGSQNLPLPGRDASVDVSMEGTYSVFVFKWYTEGDFAVAMDLNFGLNMDNITNQLMRALSSRYIRRK